MTSPHGVWITGPSRTGTSLTAGLFAAHGVFFGNCGPGDKFNRKGYWEHPLLVERVENKDRDGWPEVWWERLWADGWDSRRLWGAKRGPRAWPWVRELHPSLIVMTTRPRSQVEASRIRWGRAKQTKRALAVAAALLERVEREARCPIVTINTDGLVKGDYARILPAFAVLDLPFDSKAADAWIDPGLWCGGKGEGGQ